MHSITVDLGFTSTTPHLAVLDSRGVTALPLPPVALDVVGVVESHDRLDLDAVS